MRAEEIERACKVLPRLILAEDLTVRDAERLLRLGALTIVAREGTRAPQQLYRLFDGGVTDMTLPGSEVGGECRVARPYATSRTRPWWNR